MVPFCECSQLWEIYMDMTFLEVLSIIILLALLIKIIISSLICMSIKWTLNLI